MNKRVHELLNKQFNQEFFSAYMYLGISKFFTGQNLPGFASWYRIQAKEEQEHAMKIYDFLLDNDENVSLEPIAKVNGEFNDALDAVKCADNHEHYITAEIVNIMDVAIEEKDYRTQLFLNWFINEQAEEERNSKEMIAKVEMFGKDPQNLYLLDKEVGRRMQ